MKSAKALAELIEIPVKEIRTSQKMALHLSLALYRVFTVQYLYIRYESAFVSNYELQWDRRKKLYPKIEIHRRFRNCCNWNLIEAEDMQFFQACVFFVNQSFLYDFFIF